MATVSFDEQLRRVAVDSWSHRANSVDVTRDGKATALLGLAKDRKLLVAGHSRCDTVWVELWSGAPEESDGLAVVLADREPSGVARISLCECGERGCGNAGVQLACEIDAGQLPVLVSLLESLPAVAGEPARDSTWLGDFGEVNLISPRRDFGPG